MFTRLALDYTLGRRALGMVVVMLCLHGALLVAGVALMIGGDPALILAEAAALGLIGPYLRIAAKLLKPAAEFDRVLLRAAGR